MGRTVFVGANLPDTARNVVNRTIRLNQVSAREAGTFLALQGAQVNVYIAGRDIPIRNEETDRVTEYQIVDPKILPLTLDKTQFGATGAVPLDGLLVSTDGRLNSVNLVGEPRQVEIATTLLTQLDARRRQVAVNVKIVDVNLSNTENFNSSFSFGVNDTFFLQNSGVATLRFGNRSPQGSFDFIRNSPRKFLAQLQANITSGNAKILTDPTLVVQEGEEAIVELTENVVESVETEVDPESGVRTTTPVLAEAGLTLGVNIERIDDNGFVSLSVNPTVAAPGSQVEFDSGDGSQNVLTLLNRRSLSSGFIRLRDGQTLILSGIIQESDRTVISKVPLLGDIPLLGALFRSTDNIKERAEVIILLTPQIIDDDPRSQYGYNYNPGSAASELLQKQGFEVQNPNPQQQQQQQQQQNQRQEVEQ
jgi:type IV pilus assembly protein PilQ